ncbi:MAG: MarR family transcriptional regulator [Oscillospiraceae bacterium]|nr:MarR family transcriptional regulator [Oscillospiraceae bacterium]
MCETNDDQTRHLGFEIRRLSNLLRRNFDGMAVRTLPQDITGVQIWMLGYIARESVSGDVFQRDIEKRFNVRRASATGMLQLLEKNGMITRESVPYDARLKKIVLTDRGRSASEAMHKNIGAFEKEITDSIEPDDLAAFYRVIDTIRGMLE